MKWSMMRVTALGRFVNDGYFFLGGFMFGFVGCNL